ncbi:hypothetical protein ACTWKC_07435 [Bacillus sp. 4A_MP3]|uniref:hypothetical protein n=1 Tax=Bacillus TaxID=1386 RepID=UPI0013318095|nr:MULTISPECIES: hypothetical protein [Bacillus amyloliquefaciens group]NRF34865.1 hypothetical protein [Bacillus velezensis]UBM45412.1 hypothetical protein LAZ98_18430 [Bacillus velezensis]
MKLIRLNNYERLEGLNGEVIKSLYEFDRDLHYSYNNTEFSLEGWWNELINRLRNNTIYIILLNKKNIMGYTAFLEDEKYKNFYVKNFTVNSRDRKNVAAFRILLREVLKAFIQSKYEVIRFSTHKSNKLMNSMCLKNGFIKTISGLNGDYNIYSMQKDKLRDIQIYKRLVR